MSIQTLSGSCPSVLATERARSLLSQLYDTITWKPLMFDRCCSDMTTPERICALPLAENKKTDIAAKVIKTERPFQKTTWFG